MIFFVGSITAVPCFHDRKSWKETDFLAGTDDFWALRD
uniref:Uncharacterized protein LOC8281799 isoform X2 n=1 Tax=Rhizophora mucronata TaxID=61149 RepID=A0A2P2QHU1_RHIMU